MIRGLYISASSMLCETIRQDMIANNLANIDSIGFKREQGIFKELPGMELVRVNDGKIYPPRPTQRYPKIGTVGTGVLFDETFTNMSVGDMEYTEKELDVAIGEKNTFFLIDTPQGLRYSRDGAFQVNKEGYLVNSNGDYVVVEAPPFSDSPNEVVINENDTAAIVMQYVQLDKESDIKTLRIVDGGLVQINGETKYKIVTVVPSDRKAFRKEGNNYFIRAYGEVYRGEGDVKAGYREKPNFSVVEEMVKMIEVARAYEANAKMVESHDSLLDKAINSVGAPRN